MPMTPGNQTVTFDPPGSFVVDKYHTVPASSGATSFPQSGCLVQTAGVKDKVSNTAYAEATHRVYTPFNTNIDGVEEEWYIVDGSEKFRVLGFHKDTDSYGRCYQALFICKEEHG